jgi:hypothetical protein
MKFVKKTKYYTGTVYEWNLPTGFTCPFAEQCLVKVDRQTGKMDNKSDQYRCYASSAERFPAVREHRWKNFEYVKAGGVPIVPQKAKAVRIHSAGDFFNQSYFDTWLTVCRNNSRVEFWAYTKSVRYWVNRLHQIPDNLVLTASYGGREDYLIEEHELKNVIIVKSVEEANGRPIDTNDDLARVPKLNFALLDNFV